MSSFPDMDPASDADDSAPTIDHSRPHSDAAFVELPSDDSGRQSDGDGSDPLTFTYLPGIVSVHPIERLRESDERSHYTRSTQIDQGGMGRVWLAKDESLRREVALKELLPHRTDAATQRRFLREAQITGQLEHPHIVTVYELARRVGTNEYFYTMRLLRGPTLRDAIARWHAMPDGPDKRRELRRLLRAFVDIGDAIAYAHARGVVHRDLKPGNIKVGPFGEAVVLDWGMAKIVGQAAETWQQLTPSDPAGTALGSVFGTPAYASPEQAAGMHDLVGTRTDVYGLGAILYCLLTDDAPHPGNSQSESLQHALNHPTPHARDIRPEAPAALDAIAARAMAERHDDRYASAADLVADVEAYLSDEPVAALPDTRVQALQRWMRHHRHATLAIVASLAVIALAAIVSTVVVEAARRREADARQQAQTAQAEAQRRFLQARGTVDRSFTQLANLLAHFPAGQTLRNELLEQAVAEYESFAQERADDRDVRIEVARARLRLGQAYRLLERHDASESATRNAVDGFRALLEGPDRSDSPAEQLGLGQSLTQLGLAHTARGRDAEGRRAFDASAKTLRKLVERHPTVAEHHAAFVRVLLNSAEAESRRGAFAEALALLNEALHATTEWPAACGESPLWQEARATVRQHRGRVLSRLQGNAAAVESLSLALADFDALAVGPAPTFDHFQGRANAACDLANALRPDGDDERQMQLYSQALRDQQTLLEQRPGLPGLAENAALTESNLAAVLHRQGRNRAALGHLSHAADELRRLWRKYPQHPRLPLELAATESTLGRVDSELDQEQLADDAFRCALETWQGAVAASLAPESLVRRGDAHDGLGRLRQRHKQWAEAEAEYRAAIADARAALAIAEERAGWELLANAYAHLAEVLVRDRADEAQQAVRAALAALAKLPEDFESRLARAWLLAEGPVAELRDSATAVKLAAAAGPAPFSLRRAVVLGAAQLRAGQIDDAIATLTESVRRVDPPHGIGLCLLSLAQSAAGDRVAARESLLEGTESEFTDDHAGDIVYLRLVREANEKSKD